MFAPDNDVMATVLLLGTMVCWGSWSSIRVLCRAEAPVFVIFYVGGQFIVGTTLGLSLGMISVENSVFNRQTFIEGLTHPGDWYRVMAIFVGGFCCANSDFLAACACTRLPFAVVVPIFMGWALMQATILNFLIEGGEDTNPLLLFAGVTAAFLGICCMALSDSHAVRLEEEYPSRLLSCSRSVSVHSRGGEDSAACKSLLAAADSEGGVEETGGGSSGKQEVTDSSDASLGESTGGYTWIFVSIFSGFLAGLWSPMGTFGRTKGSYPVDNPSVALFFFQLGSVAGIPLMLWYYGHVIHVYEKKTRNAPVAWTVYVQEALALPRSDQQYGLLAGGIVACGTYIFFTASQGLSSTIAFAICSCAPLVTIAIGVVIFEQLKNAPFLQTFYLCLSTLLFVVAVSLMVLATSI